MKITVRKRSNFLLETVSNYCLSTVPLCVGPSTLFFSLTLNCFLSCCRIAQDIRLDFLVVAMIFGMKQIRIAASPFVKVSNALYSFMRTLSP